MLHHPSFPTLSSLPISFNKFLAFTVTKSIFFSKNLYFLLDIGLLNVKTKLGSLADVA